MLVCQLLCQARHLKLSTHVVTFVTLSENHFLPGRYEAVGTEQMNNAQLASSSKTLDSNKVPQSGEPLTDM